MVIPCDIRDIQRTIIVTGQLNSSKVTRNLASKDILHENVIKQKLNPSWPVGAELFFQNYSSFFDFTTFSFVMTISIQIYSICHIDQQASAK